MNNHDPLVTNNFPSRDSTPTLFSTAQPASIMNTQDQHHRPNDLQRSTSMQSTASTSSLLQPISASSHPTRLVVHIISPQTSANHPSQAHPAPPRLFTKPSHTVLKLKKVIEKRWPGKPRLDGIRLIHGGRILQDNEFVQDIIRPGQDTAYIHLVVRPDAWADFQTSPLASPALSPSEPAQAASSAPNTQPFQPQSSLRSSPLVRTPASPHQGSSYFALPSTQPATSTPNSHGDDGINGTFNLLHMQSLPEVLDIADSIYYHRYALLYEYLGSSTDSVKVWRDKETAWTAHAGSETGYPLSALEEIEKTLFKWESWSCFVDGNINNIHNQQSNWAACLLLACQKRRQAIQSLTIQARHARGETHRLGVGSIYSAHLGSPTFITPQPPTPRDGNSQGQMAQQQQQAAAAMAAVAPAPQDVPPIPPLTMTELISMFLPVFFLTIKIGVVLYIFSHNASPTKRAILYGGSFLYLLSEMFKAWSRRRRRLEHARRRAGRAVAGNQQGHRNHTRPASRTPASQPTAHHLIPKAPLRYTAASVTQYRFWLQRIAYIGLEAEDLEMGFRPHGSQAQAWMIQVTRESMAYRRSLTRRGMALYLSYIDIPGFCKQIAQAIFLSLATLVPEVEELRAEQIRKRDNMIRDWWKHKGKQWVDKQRVEMAAQEGGDNDAAGSSSRLAAPRRLQPPMTRPRLLRHPYVLRLLSLEPSEDGLVKPTSDRNDGRSSGRQINIQEELEALRDAQRNNGAAQGDGEGADAGEEDAGEAGGIEAGGEAGEGNEAMVPEDNVAFI
ncbi:unnamed protein product [Sympodiomycopsis kandeliae]